MRTNGKKAVPKHFRDWLERQLKDRSDLDKIDMTAHYDLTLTPAENKGQFREKFGTMMTIKLPKMKPKEIKAQETEQLLGYRIGELSSRFGIELKFVD